MIGLGSDKSGLICWVNIFTREKELFKFDPTNLQIFHLNSSTYMYVHVYFMYEQDIKKMQISVQHSFLSGKKDYSIWCRKVTCLIFIWSLSFQIAFDKPVPYTLYHMKSFLITLPTDHLVLSNAYSSYFCQTYLKRYIMLHCFLA